MRDVAALAGVSLKTVSRVVNDEPSVSADVRERVGAAIARLDYRPNMAASNLRRAGARTGLVGALVQDLSNSFSAGLLRALEDSARQHGTAVLAASLDEGADRPCGGAPVDRSCEGPIRHQEDTNRHGHTATCARPIEPAHKAER